MTIQIAVQKQGKAEPPINSLGKTEGFRNTIEGRQDRLLRLPEILQNYLPVSRSTFYSKIKNGEIDPPVKLSERVSCWWESDILAYIAKAEAQS